MNKERKKKVLVLTSGGLDSILTLNIMEKAGLDVVNMPGPFSLMKWSEEIFHLRSALRIIARYSGYSGAPEKIVFRIEYGNKIKIISYIGKPDKILSDEKIIR